MGSTFQDDLKRVDDSLYRTKCVNNQLIESVLEISNAQKTYYLSQKALGERECEILQLKAVNRQVKIELLTALIERDESNERIAALRSHIERLSIQHENMQKEICDLLRGDEIDSICERFSFRDQNLLMKELRDAKCKLIKYGFPLNFFA